MHFTSKIVLLLLVLQSCQITSPQKPNILLIMCDDLGYGDTGFNGSQTIKTPYLDMMASEGLILRRFYTASPVCSPTRASVLTGRNPYRIGIPGANTGHLLEEEITVPEILRQEGYTTGHFGKWHLGTLTTTIRDANRGRPGDSTHYSIPYQHGYDQYFATESKVPTYDPMIKPVEFDTMSGEGLRFGWQAIEQDESSVPYGTYYWDGEESRVTNNLLGDNSKIIMDRVIPFVQQAVAGNQPFFATIWLHTPHLPVVADSIGMKAYQKLDFQSQIYGASISSMDAELGRLDSLLKFLAIDERTLIWFCSDNGPEVRTPGSAGIFRGRKRDLYEGGIRVPAFVRFPRGIDSGISEFPTSTYDILPTILEFLEIGPLPDPALDGISLVDAFQNVTNNRKVPMGFRYQKKMAWTTDTLKLISVDDGNSYALYNLLDDPEEKRDISNQLQDQVEIMKSALSTWISDCDQDFADRVN